MEIHLCFSIYIVKSNRSEDVSSFRTWVFTFIYTPMKHYDDQRVVLFSTKSIILARRWDTTSKKKFDWIMSLINFLGCHTISSKGKTLEKRMYKCKITLQNSLLIHILSSACMYAANHNPLIQAGSEVNEDVFSTGNCESTHRIIVSEFFLCLP